MGSPSPSDSPGSPPHESIALTDDLRLGTVGGCLGRSARRRAGAMTAERGRAYDRRGTGMVWKTTSPLIHARATGRSRSHLIETIQLARAANRLFRLRTTRTDTLFGSQLAGANRRIVPTPSLPCLELEASLNTSLMASELPEHVRCQLRHSTGRRQDSRRRIAVRVRSRVQPIAQP